MAEMLSNMAEKLANLAAEMLLDYTGIQEKMETLRNDIQVLENRAADVLAVIEEEEIYNGKKRKREVEDWLANVDRKKIKCESLNQEVQQTRFYNFYSRLQLGKLVKKTRLEVEKLAERGKFSEGLFLEVCKTRGKPLVTTEWKSQRSLKQNLKTVWPWLMNDVDSRIGIYGMGGVGKTTLAMHMHNKLLNDPKFKGRVYWINVSQDSNIHKLQHDIASVVNLDLSSEDNENQRAAELFGALRKRKSFVLILDNVWNNFDIDKIGIPLGTDGSKLLITSRSVDICHKMGCQKNIKVNVLNEVEAWELFLEKLGYGIKLPSDTEDVAKEVAKRCAGLPLGIITMGGSMRGVIDIHEWRDALEELKESSMGPDDMENKVFPLLLCSFIRLRDPKLQRCFLYCCLYPEDYRIPREELISKFISEGLMDRRNSRQASFDQGHSILNKLENASLLERADSKYVRMHDLIRDMALRIARNDTGFMVKAGLQLHVIPEEQEWEEDLDKISLMCNKISDMTHCVSPNCPRLSTLILRRNPLEKIPDAFFVHMRGLKILDLSYTWIEELPNSLSDLENLNALLLTCCVELKYVPPLTKLKELKELDLNKNKLKELPEGMQNLVNLKSLNIGFMSCMEMIPAGILPKLSHLQRLILPDHFQVPAEELEGLKNLEEFQGLFCDVHDLNQFITSQQKYGKLSFYSIIVGAYDSWSRIHPDSKRLTDKLLTINGYCFKRGRGGEDKVLLPQDIQDLKIVRCDGVSSCFSDMFPSLNSLRSLKSFRISHCTEIECISTLYTTSYLMEEKQESCCFPFQSLENLILSWLPNLTSLIRWDVRAAPPTGTFSHLKKLRIEFCNKIRKLFTLRTLQNLYSLEEVYVSECAGMEEIIGEDDGCELESNNSSCCSASVSSSYNDQAILTLPKLRALSLKWLPELRSICRETVVCDSIETIGMFQCHKIKRLPFFMPQLNGQPSPPPNLKQIRIGKDDRDWWESLEWSHSNIKNMLQPFVKYLELGFQKGLIKPDWNKLVLACLFIRRLQVLLRS
ncbi:UNVERIFIED_CONTAM: putative disease resistance protein [Sesamum radiatum]|uniref:Disease resistance protein n=2 Tax=Sesamum TaxID=4181 RepID=A0AAW2MXC2_SESRA